MTDNVATIVVGLHLLAHPTLGATGISDVERTLLRDAARLIEELVTAIAALGAPNE